MKLLLLSTESICTNAPLAREIGLYESYMLLEFYRAIDSTGVRKDNRKQIARTKKQLREMFYYFRLPSIIDKTIERLQILGYLIVSDNTLYDDSALWYSLNWEKLKELKSLVIMSDGEVDESHIQPQHITPKETNGNGDSRIYQILFGAFLKACHWDNAPKLDPRDRGEIGSAVKALIKQYPDREIDALKAMVLGIDTYRKTVVKLQSAYRPYGIMRAWTQYAEWCKSHNNGEPPEPPKE